MSDEQGTAVAEAATATAAAATKAKKAPVEVTQVTMTDGRTVGFAGKRKMVKEYEVNADGFILRLDFVNGQTRSVMVGKDDPLFTKYAAHGATQKIGDETAGDDTVDDMVLHVDSIVERLAKGEWGMERTAGDSFSGASVVVRALCEATKGSPKFPDGMSVADAKAFLEKKLAEGKDSGLTRAKLYASFRNPTSKTGQIIQRLEMEKAAKESVVDADAELAGLTG